MTSGIYERPLRGSKQSDMIGRKFGRLTVLSYDAEISKQRSRDCYRVQCKCGEKKTVRGAHLRNGLTRSCGCLVREFYKKLGKQKRFGENSPNYSHGIYAERNKFRKIIRERDVVCQICGMTDEESLIEYSRRLATHHLDGNESNDDPKNGALLCQKCHGIVTRNSNVWRPI